MALTGRAALLAVAGAVLVLVFRAGVAMLIVDLAIAVAIAADLMLAASVRRLQVSRSGDAKIQLGQAGVVTVTIVNTGRRRLIGQVRDGWRPSAGAHPGRAAVSLPAGRRAEISTTLTPTRRGDVPAGPLTVR